MNATILLAKEQSKYFFSISIIGQSLKSLKNSSRFGFMGTQFFIIMPSLFMIGVMSEGDQIKQAFNCSNMFFPFSVWINTFVAPLRLNLDETEGASQQSNMVMSLSRCNVLKWQL